jgi:flagellar motor switch protein FliN/FliY
MPDESTLTDFDSFFEGGGPVHPINPAVIQAGGAIAQTLLSAGAEALQTLLGKGVLYTEGSSEYATPADALQQQAAEEETVVVSRVAWTGDREGTLHLVFPEEGAKAVVAFMLAMLMGEEADPETTQLDDEGMDAFQEAVANLLGQASQALRQDPGGSITLQADPPGRADLSTRPPAELIGEEETLHHTGQLTIEGVAPFPVHLFLTPSVTGLSTEPAREEEGQTPEAEAGATGGGGDAEVMVNRDMALHLRIPVVIMLAEKKERMEVIRDLSPGAIIEFRKLSGEFLDIQAGNIKFAEGEVVIVNEHFGIQIRKLVDIRTANRKRD